jgi:gluconate 2-dehydrogenase gamma chain
MSDEEPNFSRREFVKVMRDGAVILMLPGPLLRETIPADYKLKFFTAQEAATIDAISARILPSDELPGAREARVVNFIDHMLATEYAGQQRAYRDGVERLNKLTRSEFKRRFVELTEADQDSVLTRTERGNTGGWKESVDFFAMVRIHTIEGMFSDPKYHGNADGIGWKLVGSDQHHG